MQRLAGRLTAVLAAGIIAAALLSLAVRLALPQANLFRDQLSDALAGMLGAQVSIGQVEARLRGFAPQFTLRDLRLRDLDSGELLLSLRKLRVDLDLSASLREGAPRIDGVTLVGADLEVVRNADSRILVRGLDKLRGSDPGARAFFLRRGRFSLANSTLHWTDHRAGVPTVHLRVKRLDLYNRYRRHLARIAARPLGEASGELTLLADLTGSPYSMGEWSGELYLRWQGKDLAQLLRGRLPAGLGIASERIDIETWNRLDAGRPVSALARLELGDVALSRRLDRAPGLNADADADADAAPAPDPDAPPAPTAVQDPGSLDLGRVAALADWQPTDSGWRVHLAKLAFLGFELPQAALTLKRLPTAATGAGEITRQRLSGLIRELPLAMVQRLAPILAMVLNQPPAATQGLQGFDLAGQARDLRFRLYLDADASTDVDANQGVQIDSTLGRVDASRTDPARGSIDGGTGEASADWQVQGAIDGLQVDQCSPNTSTDARPGTCADRRPRLNGLDLVFEAGPGGGYIGLDGRAIMLDPRPGLGGVLDLKNLAGDIQWRLNADGVLDISTNALVANTADIDTETSLEAQFYTFGASPVIKLHTRLDNGRPGNFDQLGSYLPVAVMNDGLERWLLRSVRAGTLTSGDAGFHGRLRDFPNDCGNGHFELTLNLSGGELDYLPPRPAPDPIAVSDAERAKRLGWPPIRGVDASIRFRDRSLTIEVARGELRNTRLTSGSASIKNLWRPTTMAITGQAVGPLTDGLWVLRNTPLSNNLSGVADAFDVTGDAALALELQIPLQKPRADGKPRPVGFDGALSFDGKQTLTPRALPLTLSGLNGRLRFDPAGVHAQEIAAQVDGQPIRIGLATKQRTRQAGAETEGQTLIEIAGRSTVKELARRFPSPLWSIAEGRADWTLELTLNNADMQLAAPPLNILLKSDLRGVALSPPTPLGKPADEARPLRLTTAFTGAWPMDLKLEYGANGGLMQLQREPATDTHVLARAAFAIGAMPQRLPDAPGILIDGRLDQVDLSPWLAWSRDAQELFGSSNPATSANSTPLVLPSRLEVGEVRFGALRLTDLDVRFAPRSGGWSIGFEGGGNGGSVELPRMGSDGTLRVRLDDLDLKPFVEPDPAAETPTADDDPRNIGRLALTIESLRLDDDVLGRARLSIEPIDNGVRFTEINLEGSLLSATANGRWTVDATDYVQTEIRAFAQSDDFGRLLNALDYSSEVQGAPADAELSLSWPGGPRRFSLERARGSLAMELGSGRLLAVDPGVGRMLGLVNLSALTRRLALDFTDVTDPGFGFDSIRGNLSIGSGLARIGQFELLSSTADIRITGIANLVDHTLDQQVQVTPKVGSGVAIAGAVAGGPLVGAAVLLADKVSGGALDRIGRQDYRVTGAWTEPRIERLSVSNSISSGSSNGASAANSKTAKPRPATTQRTPEPPSQSGAKTGSGSARDRPAPKADNPFLEGF